MRKFRLWSNAVMAVLCVSLLAGCEQKQEPATPKKSIEQAPKPTPGSEEKAPEKKVEAPTSKIPAKVAEVKKEASETKPAEVLEKKVVETKAEEPKVEEAKVLVGEVDENKSLDEIRAEAEKMDAAQLREMAEKYQKEILAKKGELAAVKGELKGLSMADLAGGKAKELTGKSASLAASLKALVERFNIYLQALKKKGGDTSGLGLE